MSRHAFRRSTSRHSRRAFLATNAAAIGASVFPCRHAFANSSDVPSMCIDVPVLRDDSEFSLVDAVSVPGRAVQNNPALAPAMSPAANAAMSEVFETLPAAAPSDQPSGIAEPPARAAQKNHWSQKELRVSFLDGPTELRKEIFRIAKIWTQYADIRFVHEDGDPQAEIKITFNLSGALSGHWSYVGTDSLKRTTRQTMNLQFTPNQNLGENTYEFGVVLHEFGHALGCVHEHLSPANGIQFDERETISYFKRRFGWTEAEIRRNVLDRYNARDLIRFSEFDPKSIMIYAIPAEITMDKKAVKGNNSLSETDIKFIKLLYPKTNGNDKKDDEEVGPTKETSKALKIGEFMEGYLSPSARKNTFTVKITEASTYTFQTKGYTQVSLALLPSGASDKPIPTDKAPYTPDLVNLRHVYQLVPGDYRLEVEHKHEGGVGEYAVTYRKGSR